MSEAVDEKTGAAAPETGVKAADAGQEDMQGTEKQEKSKPGWDELMVVAYGTAKKSSFTGSAAVLKSDEIAKISNSNAVSAFGFSIFSALPAFCGSPV